MVEVATVLTAAEWMPLASAHAARVAAATNAHRERVSRGIKHPVEDFLYEYYSIRPSLLARWHPGVGVGLEDAAEHAGWKYYATQGNLTCVDLEEFVQARGSTARYIVALLEATASRPPMRGCFGLHEWAMVYRAAGDTRHPLPLRLGSSGTDAVVEAHPLVCTHIDAFRFFTPAAMPRNAVQLTRADQIERDQPGCLHANMDVFKWALKMTPVVPSDLVMDAFDLAKEIRYVDMQASPYDVSALGLDPIAIETAEGKAEYVRLQGEFAKRAAALRTRLVDALSAAQSSGQLRPVRPTSH